MKIGIIGGGSIGLLVGAYLSRQHEVTIYVRRDEQKETLNDQGLFLSNIDNPFSVQTSLLNEIKEADCFIVCVKQHQIDSILPFIQEKNRHTPLLFMQNGMGHIKRLQRINGDLYIGVVEHGALKKTDNRVNHTGIGTIKIAAYYGGSEKLPHLIKQLHQPDFPIEKALDWKKLLAKKLIVNAVINPLTALFDVPNNEIINNPYIFQLAQKLCYEAATVLDLDYESEFKKIKEIAYQTGENLSSMLIDIKEGRQTENEAISGYLLETSDQEMPYTSFVYNGIRALEINNAKDKTNG